MFQIFDNLIDFCSLFCHFIVLLSEHVHHEKNYLNFVLNLL